LAKIRKNLRLLPRNREFLKSGKGCTGGSEWLTTTGSLFGGHLPLVKRDPGSLWNRRFPLEFMAQVHCQNVCFLPKDIHKPKADQSDLVAIYVYYHERILDV